MPDEMQSLILSELRELRSEYNKSSRETGERLARLENSMKTAVTGNGTKSRLAVVEEAVESLKAWRWQVIGISTGASAVVGLLFHFVK